MRGDHTIRLTRRALLAGSGLSLLACQMRMPASAARPVVPPWGFDLAGMDRAVHPGDDFFRFVGGRWLETAEIPADRSSWGPFYELRAKAESEIKSILDALASTPHPPGSEARKIADCYGAYLDVDAIERRGLEPARADLAAIESATSHEEVARLCLRRDLGARGPVSVDIWADDQDPDRYSVNISQGGLGLPNRDYYLRPEPNFADVRAKYQVYIGDLLALAGAPDPAASAHAIFTLETRMAELHWPAERVADRHLTYNPMSREQFMAVAPEFPWGDAFDALEVGAHDLFGAKQPDAIAALAKLFRATPVAQWRDYLTFHYLNAAADVLPQAFDDLAFDFNGRTLTGRPSKSERWKRATSAVNVALGEAVGRLYVERHFPPEAKAQVRTLVEALRIAFRARIEAADWMSPATKAEALRKLERLRIKIGYPDQWRDYATLDIRPGDALGNRARARLWDWLRRVARLDRPTDREEWGMTPQTVNAYYNASFNEIAFPAAILQAPYFDPDADAAVNFGGIGAVIGHEMSHGFDDQGSKSDANGVLRSWWTTTDVQQFGDRSSAFVEQYNKYEALPGLQLNGKTTLSENLADNTGATIAYDAYRLSLGGAPAPVLDGFSGAQRFFLSYAQTYRQKAREAQLRRDVASDPHSPPEFRVNGVVRNMDAWYEAFGVQPADRLYLAPGERIRVW